MNYIIKSFPVFDPQTGHCVQDAPPKKIECVRIRVEGDLLQTAISVDQKKTMSYYGKKTRYGKGFINKGPLTSGIIGLIGEAAGALYFDMSTDWSHKRMGDGGYDFIITGRKLDVKTSGTPSLSRNYIRRVEYFGQRKQVQDLKSIVYVGGYIENSNTLEEGYVDVILIGYITKRFLEQQPILKSPRRDSSHENTEMYWSSLLPVRSLLKQHELYKERHKEICPTE